MQPATLNASEMKRRNRSLVLRHIRERGCSRVEIARRTGLTRAAISVLVDELLQEGILLEGAAEANGAVGRRATRLSLNPDAFYILGLSLTRGVSTLGLTDFRGTVLREADVTVAGRDTQEVLDGIDRAVRAMLQTPPPGRLLGMGILAPGPLDTRRGLLLNPPNFHGWRDIPLGEHYRTLLGAPALLENNAAALALAEKSCGLGHRFPRFLAVVVDTGVGGGFVTPEGLYKGSAGFGTEIGHTSICFDGPLCTCGNRGCAELYASIPNILRYAAHLCPDLTTWPALVDAAAEGRTDAQAVLDREADYLACMMTNAVQLLDVPTVVFFGDVCYRFEVLSPRLEARINGRGMGHAIRRVRVYPSALAAPATFAAANLVLEAYIQADLERAEA